MTPPHRHHHIEIVESFDPAELPEGRITRLRLSMVGNGLGGLITVPVIVARGVAPGPVMGLTAAIHGNELNGMKVIQKLLADLDPSKLAGTVIAVPVVNVPGYLMNTRQFNDGADLNRVMPGKLGGTMSQVYAHRFMNRVVEHLDYLIDLHTASFGRINTLYVRADMTHPETSWMARAQQPQILLHNTGTDGTLRGAAMDRGVHAITVEVGNPNRFQETLISQGVLGVSNVLTRLGMINAPEYRSAHHPALCIRSYWLYTELGGVLEVFPDLGQRVRAGEVIARVSDIFGDTQAEYVAPEDGIVIGKSTHPVNQTGSRILHLGVEGTLESA
ncbi:MAG: succinylglutamate desuccinylase/aspartoacylase family protein [Deltaproteobacteria bacterium]|nr:succinylglutamate desuccinylase/aspartoacylase family protein [Deltaproteobacteria bacterium]